jgi:equilibrative nucleoside transporter 1/2/3
MTAEDVPIDKRNLAYIIMFYEGVGNLFPWNAFITAAAYFAARFCGSFFSDNFENYFSFAYTLSQTIGLALSIKFQNSLSLRSKIVYPLAMYSISFLVTTILVTIKTEPTLLFGVTLFQTALCGICGAILSGGLFGLGAMFPPAYTGALMSGQGLAGLIVSVASLLTQLASNPIDDCSDSNDAECLDFSLDFSALAYFIIATVILGCCGVAFVVLLNLEFTQ